MPHAPGLPTDQPPRFCDMVERVVAHVEALGCPLAHTHVHVDVFAVSPGCGVSGCSDSQDSGSLKGVSASLRRRQ